MQIEANLRPASISGTGTLTRESRVGQANRGDAVFLIQIPAHKSLAFSCQSGSHVKTASVHARYYETLRPVSACRPCRLSASSTCRRGADRTPRA
jgi:hypothetical protein